MISMTKERESLFPSNFIEQKRNPDLNNVNVWRFAYFLHTEYLIIEIYAISLRHRHTMSNKLKRSKI